MRTWTSIHPEDQYSEPGDSLFFESRYWLYFWNSARRTVRRYGLNQEYQEAQARKKPDVSAGSRYLSVVLSMFFVRKKRAGALLVDQR